MLQAYSRYFLLFSLFLFIITALMTKPILHEDYAVFDRLQILLLALALLLYAIGTYYTDNFKFNIMLFALIIRITLVVIPIIKYGNFIGITIDDSFHIWFTHEILRTSHVPTSTIYSESPLLHVLTAILSNVLFVDVIIVVFSLISSTLFLLSYMIVLLTFRRVFGINRGSKLLKIIIYLILAIPSEHYAFLARPRIMVITLLLMLVYIYLIRSLQDIYSIIMLVVLYTCSILTNYSYAVLFLVIITVMYLALRLLQGQNHTLLAKFKKIAILFSIILIVYMLISALALHTVVTPFKRLADLSIVEQSATLVRPYSTNVQLPFNIIITSVILIYNSLLIYFITSLVTLAVVVWIIMTRRYSTVLSHSMLLILYIISFIVSLIFIPIIYMTTKNFSNALRPVFITASLTPIATIFILDMANRIRYINTRIIAMIIVILVILGNILFIANFFASKYTSPFYTAKYDNYTSIIPITFRGMTMTVYRFNVMYYFSKYLDNDKIYIALGDRTSIYLVTRFISYNEYKMKWRDIIVLLRRTYANITEAYNMSNLMKTFMNVYRDYKEHYIRGGRRPLILFTIVTSEKAGHYGEPLEYRDSLFYIRLKYYLYNNGLDLIYSLPFVYVIIDS